MAKSVTIPFPEWAPDLSDLGTGVSALISGCVPRADGYGPFKMFQSFTQALPDRCRGGFFARRTDGSISVFAGTATRLYLLDNTTFAWTDVSKGAAAYSTLVAADNWQFAQFEDLVLAVQAGTAPQSFALGSSTEFADLGGSPPLCSHIAIINGFIVLTGIVSTSRRIQWCDLFAPTTWTAGVGLADFQDLPDGGTCHGLSGGDFFGVVFQDEAIRTLIYAPGSATVFNIVRISRQDTLYAQYSVITANDKTYFLSAQGFKRIDPGGVPVPIGRERVDRTFFEDVDQTSLGLVIGSADPTSSRVYWAYKSKSGNAGLFDKVLAYDPTIGENGRWSVLPISGEFLLFLAKPGLTLEALDAIAPTALVITGAADNGAGLIRLELVALSNADFSVGTPGNPSQNFISVYGVGGTVEANATWAYNVIDATHIDLIGSAFVNAWTAGGQIGGSLDALPFSLDDISTAAVSQLAAFGPSHRLGFFTGDNYEAIVETEEQDGEGDMIFVSNLRPITDCAGGLCSLGYRNTAQAVVAYTAESAIDTEQGQAPQLLEARYIKARLRQPQGAVWTYARGIQPSAQTAGTR